MRPRYEEGEQRREGRDAGPGRLLRGCSDEEKGRKKNRREKSDYGVQLCGDSSILSPLCGLFFLFPGMCLRYLFIK